MLVNEKYRHPSNPAVLSAHGRHVSINLITAQASLCCATGHQPAVLVACGFPQHMAVPGSTQKVKVCTLADLVTSWLHLATRSHFSMQSAQKRCMQPDTSRQLFRMPAHAPQVQNGA